MTKFNYTGFQKKKKVLLDSLSERLKVELKEFGKIKSNLLIDMKRKRPSKFKKYQTFIQKVVKGFND